MTTIITKQERFDENIYFSMVNDSRFCEEALKKLIKYRKNGNRITGGTIQIEYRYAFGCEELQLGRLYCKSVGLQNLRSDMRNPLSASIYWEIDITNCHYLLARYECIKYNIHHNAIDYYLLNREECLNKVNPRNRQQAKTEFLKIAYGGNILLYNENYIDEPEIIPEEGIKLLNNVKREIDVLRSIIWENNQEYHKIRTGKDKIIMHKRPNRTASLLSLVLSTKERLILMEIDKFFITQGRYFGVLIHDGGYLEKLSKDEEVPLNLIKQCEDHIKSKFGYDMFMLKQKPIEHNWTSPVLSKSPYEKMKEDFEKSNFMIGSNFCHINDIGQKTELTMANARVRFENLYVQIRDIKTNDMIETTFFDQWRKDPKRRAYDCQSFIPDIENCPDTVYNLFDGFEVQKKEPDYVMSTEKINELVKIFIDHLNILTGGQANFTLSWLANIIQKPHMKSQVAILFRDMGSLWIKHGGTGKNLFIEWFGNVILGPKYFLVIGDNRELYTNFNSQQEGKLLIYVEEANGKDNFNFADLLKSRISSSKININCKGKVQYDSNDYARFIFATNWKNTLQFGLGNRRLAVHDVDTSKRGNIDYFKELVTQQNNEEAQWAFYQYLLNYKTYESPIEFQIAIPINKTYLQMQMANVALHLKWIIHRLEIQKLWKESISVLHKRYEKWCFENNKKENTLSLIKFSQAIMDGNKDETDETIGQITTGMKLKTRTCNIMNWNYTEMIQGLKNSYLLPSDYNYTGTEYPIEDDDLII